MQHHKLSPSKFVMWEKCIHYESSPITSDVAESGIRQHKALENMLNNRDLEVVLKDNEFENVSYAYRVISEIIEGKDFRTEYQLSVLDDNLDLLYYGTADVVCGNIIIDYKSGRQRDYSAQQTAYAYGLMQSGNFEEVEIIEVYGMEKTINRYSIKFDEAFARVSRVIDKRQHKGVLHPEPCDYCSWCAKKNNCTAFTTLVKSTASNWGFKKGDLKNITKAKPEQLSKMAELADIISAWSDEVKGEVKKRLVSGVEVPGYSLQEKRGRKSVINAGQVCSQLHILSPEDLDTVASVSLTKLVKHIQNRDGISKKDAENEVYGNIAEFIVIGDPSVSLVKSKGDK